MTDVVEKKTAKNMVTLTIDNIEVTVPEGTNVVDASRMAGIDIPVFCHHPKLEPVGMCRMCLVDIGLPVRSRETGEFELNEDGSPVIQFERTLQTGCTFPVSEGMVVVGYSDKVTKARQDVIEFLLTSHPLDCPVCDKGGECPLQNLTMDYGAGESRFVFSEKKHLGKHVPLGDLIFLDRERCIQCARCIRFQAEIAGDPVIEFDNRGRSTEIITFSDPGFDSYWSGNTSDICPVGALTTADFRFGARPWEMNASASICNHCPVGCNLTLNTRREAKSGGNLVIKRTMPRQNEGVNEIWICDKGRFGFHFAGREERLTKPLVRENGKLVPTSWKKALDLVAEKFEEAGYGLVSLTGGRLSNEDLFNINALTAHLGGKALLDSEMAGGDLAAQVGVGEGTNIGEMGAGDAILVVASDLEEEAPLYWLRVKQAAERGAVVIVANPRKTKLDRIASHVLRYGYGQEAAMVLALLIGLSTKAPKLPDSVKKMAGLKDVEDAAEAFDKAENAVVLYGSEGLGLEGSQALAQACANLLLEAGYVGKPNNGLIAIWDKGNAQGAWDMGLRPSGDLASSFKKAKATYIVGADPVGDDLGMAKALQGAGFVVVQELRKTATAEMADVVLPIQAFTEREGTYTNAERRVQRFYPAVTSPEDLMPDFAVAAEIAGRLGLELEKDASALVFLGIIGKFADYADLDYRKLSEVSDQWSLIGREDVYYGGTSYHNSQGLGVQLKSAADRGETITLDIPDLPAYKKPKGLVAVPVSHLYDQGSAMLLSDVLQPRLAKPYVTLHPEDAEELGAALGAELRVEINGAKIHAAAGIDNSLPKGVVLIPRSLGMPVTGPAPVVIKVK